jgi:hypothetical protein
MKLFGIIVLFSLGILAASADAVAGELAGYWQNDEQPAWIEIRFENGVGTGIVRRNDNKPDAVGRILLKDIVSDENNPGSWYGQIYAARLGEYKDAVIMLPAAEHMEILVSVGFMSRTVTWTRAVSTAAPRPITAE